MRWTPLLMATTMLALPLPLAAAADATCTPTSARADAAASADGQTTYYARAVEHSGVQYFELWKESNGEAGLQTKAGMSCGGMADTLVQSLCASRFCAITL